MAITTNGKLRETDPDFGRLVAELERRLELPSRVSSSDGGHHAGTAETVTADLWGMDAEDDRQGKAPLDRLRDGLEAVGVAATAGFAHLDRLVVGFLDLAREAVTRLKESPWVWIAIWSMTVAGIAAKFL